MSLETRKIASKWDCAGNVDLFMLFHWLKTEVMVKKVLEVVIDDGARKEVTVDGRPTAEKKSHSDRAIVECLKGLDVETLDWQRVDIPAEVIVRAAGKSVKSLYLYCSGLQAVLQSWADTQGLSRLENVSNSSDYSLGYLADKWQLEYVQVEIDQVRSL